MTKQVKDAKIRLGDALAWELNKLSTRTERLELLKELKDLTIFWINEFKR